MTPITKYTFSGHESFPCKTLWLKKGYDFVCAGHNFNAPDAVVRLGVGKNMVASIRYWLRAFGITQGDQPTPLGHYLFSDETGKDPYMEDLGTLWLLHHQLIATGEATLYRLLFTRLQAEQKAFDRQQAVNFVKRCMAEDGKQRLFNENTVRKDVGVLLLNYVLPVKPQGMEDYSTLLMDLDLIRTTDGKSYLFNIEGKRQVTPEIFLHAILAAKGADQSVDYDTLQAIGLAFCMNDMEVIAMLLALQERHKDALRYSDTAGMRQLQFLHEIGPKDVLDSYYNHGTI